MMDVDADADLFLGDHGVPCSVGTHNFLGIKDEPDEEINVGGFGAQSTSASITVKTTDVVAASIKLGVTIRVDGTDFSARVPRRLDDGVFSIIPLTKI